MEVILLEKVSNLGSIGDKVNVRNGYGRNFLIPNHKAVFATEENIKHFEKRRAELEKKAAEILAQAKDRAKAISELKVVIASKAGEEGRLYGSIGTRDIAQAITDAGQELAKSEVRLPTGPIRQTGDHVVSLHLHTDVAVQVTVHVVAEK